jgi:hypothetical protein
MSAVFDRVRVDVWCHRQRAEWGLRDQTGLRCNSAIQRRLVLPKAECARRDKDAGAHA